MGNAKVVVGVRLLKVSLTSYGHSLLQPARFNRWRPRRYEFQ